MLEGLVNIIGIRPLIAMAISLVLGGMGSGAAVWTADHWWFDHVSTPQIQRAQKEADVTAFEAETDAAKKARELEIFRFIERQTNQFYQNQIEDDAWHQAQLLQLQLEIQDYAKQGDHGPGLSEGDLHFLLGGDPFRLRAKP